jgi:hypothetical protein
LGGVKNLFEVFGKVFPDLGARDRRFFGQKLFEVFFQRRRVHAKFLQKRDNDGVFNLQQARQQVFGFNLLVFERTGPGNRRFDGFLRLYGQFFKVKHRATLSLIFWHSDYMSARFSPKKMGSEKGPIFFHLYNG